jgi:folate-binding protein YgfZ
VSGEARFSALADDRGRYLADFWVILVGDDWRLDVAAGLAEGLVRRLNMYAVSSDAELHDLDDTHVLYHLEGPVAGTVFGSWIGGGVAEPRPVAGRVEWRDEPVEYCRRSHFGEPGYTVLIPRCLQGEFGTELATICEKHGVVEAGTGDAESLRVQAGRPLGGVDLCGDDLLQETGLLAAISLTKGCYPGQEILQRIAKQGKARKRLSGLRVRGVGSGEPLAGATVLGPGGEEVGRVTSDAVSGPDRLALGWMTKTASAIGGIHRIVTGGAEHGVEAVDLPFVSGSLGPLAEVPRRLEG